MKAAVLCTGPSLVATWHNSRAREYDLVVGVNHSLEICVCDVACVGDRIYLTKIRPRYIPALRTLLTRDDGAKAHAERWHRCLFPFSLQRHLWSDLDWPYGREPSWSSVAAICYCMDQDMSEIHCYGMDLHGDKHAVSDHPAGGPDRWRREMREMSQVYALCRTRGIRFVRHLSNGTIAETLDPDTGADNADA